MKRVRVRLRATFKGVLLIRLALSSREMTTLAAARCVKIATLRIHASPRLYNTLQNQSRVDCFFSFPFLDQSLFQRRCPGSVLPSRFIGSEICMSIGEREVRLRLRCVSSQGASRFRTLLCPCSHAASMAPSSQLTYPSSDFSRALWISGACSCFLSFSRPLRKPLTAQVLSRPVMYVTCTSFQSKTRQMYKILLLHSFPGADY